MKYRVVVVLSLAGALFSRSAVAEDSIPAATVNRLPETVVTAARLPEEQVPLAKFPANVTVLSTNELTATPAFTLPEALRQEVGLTSFDTSGFGQFANLCLRGYGDKGGTLFLVDGVRVNDAGMNNFLWNTVPLGAIERIEVIRGGGSTTYGEGAIGGVVNIVTRRPTDKLISVEATAAGGNLGYYSGHITVSGKTNFFDYVISGGRQEWSGWRESSSFRGWTASVKPGITTPIGRFSLGYYFHDETSLNPGPLTAAQNAADPRQAGSPIFPYTNVIHRATLDYEKCFANGWAVLGKFYGQVNDSDNSGWAFVHIEQPNYGTTWQVSQHREVFNRPNILTLGIEAIQQDFSSDLSSVFGNSHLGADNWTASAFVQEAITILPKLTLTSGVRFDYRHWDIDVMADSGTDIHTERRASVWSPKLGATYEFAEKTTGWLALSRAYRLPSGNDIGTPSTVPGALYFSNPDIKPVIANTAELGARVDRWQLLSGNLAGYYSQVTDDIVLNPFTYSNENFDSRRWGTELTLRSQPAAWVDFYYTTAYTDARFDNGPFKGSRLPFVPEWQLTGGVNVRPVRGLQLTLEAVHVRDQVVENDVYNRFPQNDYVVGNAKVRYTWRNVTVFAAVNNLFDTRYETFPTLRTDFFGNQTRWFNPAAGINFQAGTTISF
jgi:iron complex outermembrane receptor protein